MNLPPGFRFYPTDEELVAHFLQRKPSLLPCHPDVIPDLQLYPLDPWDLDGKALVEGKKWYYYSRKTHNRITENGYWQEWGGDDEPITNSGTGKKIGVKKYYVFHLGEAPEGVKTSWIMQEYRLSDGASSRSSKRRSGHTHKIDYSKRVICLVYEQDEYEDDEDGTELSCLDEVFLSLDDFDEISYP